MPRTALQVAAVFGRGEAAALTYTTGRRTPWSAEVEAFIRAAAMSPSRDEHVGTHIGARLGGRQPIASAALSWETISSRIVKQIEQPAVRDRQRDRDHFMNPIIALGLTA
jgi:hypothetical protein